MTFGARLWPFVVLWLAGCAATPPPPPPPPAAPAAAAAQAPELPAPVALELAAAAPEAGAAFSTPAEPLPRARLDPLDDGARGNLWERVRAGFALPDLDHELVRKWEQYYASRPEYLQRMNNRGARYLFHIVEELQRRGLPTDLALLPFIESAFDPQALSAARAAGMWQFMPGTGRDFELKQNLFRDDRRDILASTRAALDYLQKLHAQFGDWHLALAAYNWGQGNVLKAQARNQRRGAATGYLGLTMPVETRNYVPKLQAIKNIVARPEAFGLNLPPLENHPHFITVALLRDIDVALAAELAGLSTEQFRQLNPQLEKPVILAAGTARVLLPYDAANRFVRNLEAHQGPLASWTAWVAPKTVKPAEAARQVGMPEAELRMLNSIPARMLVKAGSTLLVSRGARHHGDVTEHQAEHATITFAPEAQPKKATAVRAAVSPKARGAARKADAAATPRAPAAAKARPSPTATATATAAKRDTLRATVRTRVRVARQQP